MKFLHPQPDMDKFIKESSDGDVLRFRGQDKFPVFGSSPMQYIQFVNDNGKVVTKDASL